MGRQNWKTTLAAGSATLALAAVSLVMAAALGEVAWPTVIAVAATAVVSAVVVLATDGEGRRP
ncbi:hypothetical protein [Streptomyces sp.]|uniref:hypothetical protein n=1 Tax=Streptomyces sp. TaxID=1931 RepID=UPI002F3EA883